ncbi:MAG: hypothetical protein QF681_17565 [Vicinamibacterales bacterium]|jgi:hypothetical protein|nr:hypothetical protein [Vicinamibacterales bacterium]
MTDERTDEQMTPLVSPTPSDDASIDQEIQDLLAVDPSPEFEAKVRTRVATEAETSGWRFGWLPVAAGTAVVAVLVLAVIVSRPEPTMVDASPDPVSTAARTTDPIPPPALTPASPPEEVLTTGSLPSPQSAPESDAPRSASVSTVQRPTPNELAPTARSAPPPSIPATLPPGPPRFARIVISTGEATALRRLFAQVRAREVTVPAPADSPGPVAALESPAEILIPRLSIEPMTLALID